MVFVNSSNSCIIFTEAGYSEITEVCWIILFIHSILLFVGVVVKYIISVNIDNIEAILLFDKTSLLQQMNHIYVRHNYISEYL